MVTRVMVTGGAGMLGRTLSRRLAADGHEVISVDIRPAPDRHTDIRPAPDRHTGVRQAIADIRDTPAMTRLARGVHAVVHCAGALPSYPADQISSVIVGGTRSVLAASAAARVERVVHISSTAVYGLPEQVPTPEGYPLRPVDTYGHAKVAAEAVCAQHRARGMCVPILRPKTFLGPGRMGLFAMLFEWAEEGRNFPVLGSGNARIQMLAIEDLVAAVSRALTAPRAVAGDTYNIAAAEFGTLREDFQAVLDAAGHHKRVVSLPARPALAGLKALDRARLSPVYGRLLHKLLADSHVSIAKAGERLGFVPRFSNREAILRTFAWWRDSRTGLPAQRGGRTSGDAWRQGALALAKAFF